MRFLIKTAMILIILFGLLFFGCASGPIRGSTDAPLFVETDKGRIAKARYKLAKPRDWNKKILIVAPGWRPPDAKLHASLRPGDPFELALLENGWLIATTSYRRTGLIIEDGIEDLQKLVKRIEKYYGPAETLVIEGSSMGGAIGVLIAEGEFFPKHLEVGVLAVGVGLEESGEAGPLPLTHRPLHPLVLMSNRSEWQSPLSYARMAPWNRNRPALWYLDRDGHVNVNSAERLLAVEAMVQWLDSGKRPEGSIPFGLDVTVDLSDRSSTVQELPNGYRVKVTSVDPVFGNVDTDMVLGDLLWMQDASGMGFNARGNKLHFIQYGTTYSDVGPEEFVAFLTAEGFVRIARNMGHAARGLRCKEGDYLEITINDSMEFFEKEVPRCPTYKKNRRPQREAFDHQ